MINSLYRELQICIGGVSAIQVPVHQLLQNVLYCKLMTRIGARTTELLSITIRPIRIENSTVLFVDVKCIQLNKTKLEINIFFLCFAIKGLKHTSRHSCRSLTYALSVCSSSAIMYLQQRINITQFHKTQSVLLNIDQRKSFPQELVAKQYVITSWTVLVWIRKK